MRRLELATDGSEIRIQFPYDERLLDVVRGLPRRRWDRNEKAWFCPGDEVVVAVETLLEHRFQLAAEVRDLYREKGGEALSDEADPEAPTAAGPGADSITVSELNSRVRRALRQAFPQELWLVGEITGFERNRHRRHVYFELAEKDGEGDGAQIQSTVTAVLFERERQQVEERLAASAQPFELTDGIEVRVLVRVDLYEPRGSYQVIVEDIDPVHTLGKIAQNRAKVLAELDRLGLRERNLHLPMPVLPLRVGLITSVGSDAYNDFVNELEQSGFSFRITALDARMSGAALERQMVRAVQWFGERAAQFDVLAIVRGGGSRTDLLWFDSLAVAVAVARCPMKVVTGIGHHRDVSVLDLITYHEKTPTAAAQGILRPVRECADRLRRMALVLGQNGRRRLREARAALHMSGRGLVRMTRGAVRGRRDALRAARDRVAPVAVRRLRRGGQALVADAWRLRRSGRLCVRDQGRRLAEQRARARAVVRSRLRLAAHGFTHLVQRLRRPWWRPVFARRHERLRGLASTAAVLHPSSILRRGFALVRDEQGRLLRSADQVRRGDRVAVHLSRGTLDATVEDTHLPGTPSSPNPTPARNPTDGQQEGV